MNRVLFTAALVGAGMIGGIAGPMIAGAAGGTDYSDSGSFQPAVSPERVYDSRELGIRLTTGVPVTIDVPSVPLVMTDTATGNQDTRTMPARAVIVNLTAVHPDADGYLTAWSVGQPQPTVSNVNFHANEDESNLAVVYVTGGQIQLVATADTDVVVDLFGQFEQRNAFVLP